MVELTKAGLLEQLAEAWANGYKAGWTDYYRDDKAFKEDEPEITVTPNPYLS